MSVTDIIASFNYLKTLHTFKNSKSEVVRKKTEEFYTLSANNNNNTLYTSKLVELYQSIITELFGFMPEEHLKSLLEIFAELYPFETIHIKKYLETYKFLSLSKDRILLKGDVQSGKTAMMILTAMCYLVCNRDVVFIVRNKNDDKIQLCKRFELFVRDLQEKKNYTNKNFQIIKKIENAPTDSNCVFVEIYRKDNIEKLHTILKTRNPESAVLFVDEADSRDDTTDSEFIDLCNLTGTNLLVSATVQDILVSKWGIRGDTIIPLITSNSYRGINTLKFICKENLNETDELFWTICDIAVDTDYLRIRPEHPKILLISIDRTLSVMDNLYDQFKFNRFEIGTQMVQLPQEMKDICVIEYTGKGIQMFHWSLNRHEIKNCKNGQIIFKKDIAIKDVLLWLAKNGGYVRFPNIVIISGDMASRGINFACWDPEEPKNNWHITHQILMKTKNSSCSTVIQACRILGNHGDNIPLKLYTNKECEEKIKKGNQLTRELIDCITNEQNPFYKTEWKNRYTHEICTHIPIRKSDKPGKFLAKKSEKKCFNLVGDYEPAIPLEEDTKEIEKCVFLIHRHKLNDQNKNIYDSIVKIMKDQQILGIWIKKMDLVNRLRREFNPQIIKNRTWHWIQNMDRDEYTEYTEYTKGFLIKNDDGHHYMRLNL